MRNPALAPEERFTYRHYRTWPETERWELIAGHAYAMSAAPQRRHKKLAGRLFAQLFDLYQRHGVREYWVVDPDGRWLCVYRLDAKGRYDEGELREPGRNYRSVASTVLEGFVVDPERLFADPADSI